MFLIYISDNRLARLIDAGLASSREVSKSMRESRQSKDPVPEHRTKAASSPAGINTDRAWLWIGIATIFTCVGGLIWLAVRQLA